MPTVTSANRAEFIEKELERKAGKTEKKEKHHHMFPKAAELAHHLSVKAEHHHDHHHHHRAHMAHELAHEMAKPHAGHMKHHKDKMHHHHKMMEHVGHDGSSE